MTEIEHKLVRDHASELRQLAEMLETDAKPKEAQICRDAADHLDRLDFILSAAQ